MPAGQDFITVGGVDDVIAPGIVPGLRERKKLDTRRALSDAALELTLERGLDNVTREDIAERAGVSLRTFSNYFTGKHDALVYRQVERMRRALALFLERPGDEPLWSAITESVLRPLEDDGAADMLPTPQQLATIRVLAADLDTRFAASKQVFADWVDAVAQRLGVDSSRDVYPRIVVGTIAAVADAAMTVYAHSDPPVPLPTLMRTGFAAVTAGLPGPGGAK